MKTVGERIRQARNFYEWSGEYLAKKVGYKNQSAIGNLENRAGGSGGHKIGDIAEALNVPVDWLLRGPDTDNIPFLPRPAANSKVRLLTFEARDSGSSQTYDEHTQAAIEIMLSMNPNDRRGGVAALRTHIQNLEAQPKQNTPALDGAAT